MSLFEKELNDLLVQTYRSIGEMEEQMVCTSKQMNLSISEIHLLEAVGDTAGGWPDHQRDFREIGD